MVNLALWRALLRIFLIALLGGLITATLVRLAPGFGLNEEQLDMRRSESSLRHAESLRAGEHSILRFYAIFLRNYVKGDLGESPLFQRRVGALISERLRQWKSMASA